MLRVRDFTFRHGFRVSRRVYYYIYGCGACNHLDKRTIRNSKQSYSSIVLIYLLSSKEKYDS